MKRVISAWKCAILISIFLSGWFLNDAYRYVGLTYQRAQACERTNCETLVATIDAVDMRPPKMTFEKKEARK